MQLIKKLFFKKQFFLYKNELICNFNDYAVAKKN